MRKHIYRVPLIEFLKLFKYIASSGISQSLDGWISSSKLFTKREREEMREFSKGLHGHLELWLFSPYF